MEQQRTGWALVAIGAGVLALVLAAVFHRAPRSAEEDLHDAVAAPVSPAMLGGARVIQPNLGYFASPEGRRAEAERALVSARPRKAARARSRQ